MVWLPRQESSKLEVASLNVLRNNTVKGRTIKGKSAKKSRMYRNPFSPPLIGITLEDAIELANNYLEIARKEYIPSKALNLIRDAKSKIKDAEKIFAARRAGDPTLDDSVANAYHEHGKLLDELGYHSKAQKSHRKAAKWGYVQAINQPADSSRLDSLSSPIHRSLCPIVALSVTPYVAMAVSNASLGSVIAQSIKQNSIKNTNLDEIKSPEVAQSSQKFPSHNMPLLDSNNTQLTRHGS
ncbi:hypothetical protein BGX26_000761 [Mortierella sp. AD094]|nr:hypothetical protein BGX26_000761 [Mortierella sp. AD094]